MSVLCYVDTETTGLDPRIHQPYEVSWWREDEDEPHTDWVEHTLEYADPKALEIGRYWERCGHAAMPGGYMRTVGARTLSLVLGDVTLVGSNPAFDAAMLTRVIGAPVWHHRMIDVSNVAMVIFGRDRPMGLAEIQEWLENSAGIEIPKPDHTAEGDVRTTKAVYEALVKLRAEPLCLPMPVGAR